jgi:hypothetical protein
MRWCSRFVLQSFLLALLLIGASPFSLARSSGSHSSSSHSRSERSSSRSSKRSYDTYSGVQRDSHGKIKRSKAATDAFKRDHPCPSTGRSSGKCPGYVIDHVTPLKRGGLDAPSNMQWQTKEEAKAKDKWE